MREPRTTICAFQSCVCIASISQVTNLQEGHDYYVRVFAVNAAGPSEHAVELKPAVTARLPFGK